MRSKITSQNDEDVYKYEKCTNLQGIVYMFKSFGPQKSLNVIPIFASLKPNQISLYLGLNSKTLFLCLKLDEISRITKTIKNSLCFDIVINQIEKNLLNIGALTLCLKDKKTYTKWFDSLEAFKYCPLNAENRIEQNVKPNSKVIVDFRKINQLLTISGGRKIPKKLGLFYENSSTYAESPKTINKKLKISRALENIVKNIKKGGMRARMLKRKLMNKLRREKQKAEEIYKRQKLVRHIMETRKQKAEKTRYRLITIEKKNKELKLLKAVGDKIKKINKKENTKIKSAFKRMINNVKQKIGENARKMFNNMQHQYRLLDPYLCVDRRLLSIINAKK